MMDKKRTAIVLNGAVFLLMLGVGLITPILPGKIYEFTQSTVQVGILAAAFALSYVIIQIPLGMLADRFGYKRFIVTGYILCGVSGFFYLLSASSFPLLIGRVIQGFGEAPLWALAPAALSIISADRKGKAIAWYNGSIHIGLTSGSLIGFISLRAFTETHICAAYILLCGISAAWVAFGVQEKLFACKHTSQDRNVRNGFLMGPAVISVLFGIFLYGIGYGVFMTIIPTYISTIDISGNNFGGLMFITFYIGITFAQLIGGPITDSKGRVGPMLVGLLLFSFGMLLFFRITSFACLFVLTISSFGLGLFLVGSLAFLNDQAGRSSKGFISGLFYFFWGSGYFFGPILLGYAGKYNYYPQGFSTIGIFGLVASFLIMLTCRNIYYQKGTMKESVY